MAASKVYGGHRPGSGRPTNQERGLPPRMVKVGITLTPEQSVYVQGLALGRQKSIPEVIRQIIESAMTTRKNLTQI